MLILVDEAFRGALGLFETLGEVRTFPGRTVETADVARADALVVRSVTRVDSALLEGSSVRFVGSATSGMDHVDTDWLTVKGITFASAAGCNAGTVAEYVLAAIFLLANRHDFDPRSKTLGVVGVGRSGAVVADWGRALGMRVLLCDPPLQRQTGRDGLVGFSELAAESDIVTLHVSLTLSGGDATFDMVDERWLSSLKTGVILINTSRGQVVCEDDLRAAIESRKLGGTVLDVWRNEPDVDRDLVKIVDFATPHIAGYSVEARDRGVRMIRDALAAFIEGRPRACGGGPPRRHASAERSAGDNDEQGPDSVDVAYDGTRAPGASVSAAGRWAGAGEVVHQACDVAAMDRAFRGALGRSGGAGSFDDLRRAFASRREFGFHRVIKRSPNSEVSRFLSHVGFRIVQEVP
jgi:erythronate-4-phosphate dehydrogenase